MLFVVDAADPQAIAAIEDDLQHVPAKIPLTLVFNKVDCSGDAVRVEAGLVTSSPAGTRNVYRLDSAGLAVLRAYLDRLWAAALEYRGDPI